MTPGHEWLEMQFAEIRPKAIAALARRFRDVELAEELFATSCLKALKLWPEKGLPDDPFAWLLTVGRNAGIDQIRRRATHEAKASALAAGPEGAEEPEAGYIESMDNEGLRDDVLRLLFICCHPDLTPQDQSAVALRLVAGMSVDEIARGFLVKPRTMEQRITRAKRAIAEADVPFETPDLAERGGRLSTVCLMLYLLFNEGWSASAGETQIRSTICEEAIRLARLLLDLFPGMSELMGLLALFLLQHSRRHARLDDAGHLISLDDQDRTLWDNEMIAEAQVLLQKALRHAAPGPYQIQAAIAAVHAQAATAGETDWREIERLYGALYLFEPTAVIKLNHAAAVAKVDGPAAALAMLEPLSDDLSDYRWFHAARGALLLEMCDAEAAMKAYERSLMLEPTEPERRFLEEKIAECKK